MLYLDSFEYCTCCELALHHQGWQAEHQLPAALRSNSLAASPVCSTQATPAYFTYLYVFISRVKGC